MLGRKNASDGQAALILILIMSMVGVFSVSTASRSIEGLRTQEIENQGNKAFRAAEAGLEAALQGMSNVSGVVGLQDNSSYNATYTAGGNDGFVNEGVEEGDLAQINLANADSSLSSLRIYWNGTSAIKASIYLGDPASGAYSVTYYTSDPAVDGRVGLNKFTPTANKAGYVFRGVSFANNFSIPIDMTSNPAPKVARIQMLYGRSSMGVEPVGGLLSDGQVVTVSSTGTVDSNLKSKVTLQKFTDRIPLIFDNVLFTNGSLTQ